MDRRRRGPSLPVVTSSCSRSFARGRKSSVRPLESPRRCLARLQRFKDRPKCRGPRTSPAACSLAAPQLRARGRQVGASFRFAAATPPSRPDPTADVRPHKCTGLIPLAANARPPERPTDCPPARASPPRPARRCCRRAWASRTTMRYEPTSMERPKSAKASSKASLPVRLRGACNAQSNSLSPPLPRARP